mmetsp:Transcript_12397/g.57370  ORF Transcript_12397/g.57370 Transcript_12397/m.57370 type:complete len:212 (-) Transcript_12397:523-1158(-)
MIRRRSFVESGAAPGRMAARHPSVLTSGRTTRAGRRTERDNSMSRFRLTRHPTMIIETLARKTKAPTRLRGKTKRRRTTRTGREWTVTSPVVQLAGKAPRPLMPSRAAHCPVYGWSHLRLIRMDGSARLGVAVSAFSVVSATPALHQPRHRLQRRAGTCSVAVRRSLMLPRSQSLPPPPLDSSSKWRPRSRPRAIGFKAGSVNLRASLSCG